MSQAAGEQVYTVKQVATMIGISEYNLRAWERRYGVVRPKRTSSGYRLYSDDDVARLRGMARLVGGGVPASRAAQTVVDQTSFLDTAAAAPGSDLADSDLVEAATSLHPQHLAQLLAKGFASGSLEAVVDAWLMPQLVRLGDAWEAGELTVAHEHFAAGGIMRALAAGFDQADPGPDSPVVLVGLPAGQRHEIPVLALAACLRRRGVDVIYLGADVPADDWTAAANDRLPRGAVMGVHAGASTAAQEVADQLAALPLPLPLWVGGSEGDRVTGAIVLPPAIGQAAAELAAQLRSGAV